ncbi:MAG: substrate-binding periplasmic protein, partial [Actinomycetota bacterium]
MSRRSTAHRTSRVLAILATSAIALTACGGGGGGADDGDDSGPAETTPIDLVDLTFQPITAGKLTLCTAAAANAEDPLRFKDAAGKWGGLEIDLATAIATRYGLTLEVTEQPADDIRVAPKAGTCDIAAASIVIDPEAGEDVVFSDKYFDEYQSLLVREADAETLITLESLAGKKVGVLKGAGEEFIANNAPDLTVEAFEDIAAASIVIDPEA